MPRYISTPTGRQSSKVAKDGTNSAKAEFSLQNIRLFPKGIARAAIKGNQQVRRQCQGFWPT